MGYEQISTLAAQGDATRQQECYGQRKCQFFKVHVILFVEG